MNISKINRIKKFILKVKYKKVIFGKDIKILGKLPYFKIFNGSTCEIGNNVVINSDFKNSNTNLSNRCKFVLGYAGQLKIGENTMLNGCSITAYKNVCIGKNCQIASFTLITDTDFHPVDPSEREKQVTRQKYNMETVNKKDVIIGNNVWIGWGSIILKGTIIGNNCVVGAGSLVVGEFPDNVVIAGNPANIIKKYKRMFNDLMEKLEYIFIDLDGTLLEGKYKHYNCYKDIINEDGGIPLDVDIYWNMKRNKITRDIYLKKSYYESTYNNFLKKWFENIEDKKYLNYDILKPDVIEKLKEWKMYADRLILITMRNNEENLYWQLDKLKIHDLFDDIIICKCIENANKYESVKNYKINRAIVVGDTEDDIKLSLSCQIKCIAITNGLRNKKFLDSDFYAEEIKDINMEDIIKKIYK